MSKRMTEDLTNYVEELEEQVASLKGEAADLREMLRAKEGEVERLSRENASLREAGRVAEKERDEARKERDRLIEGCIAWVWRSPTEYIEGGHGYEWRYSAMGDFVYTKEQAIAAVRAAAGLARGEGEASR